MKIYLLIGAKYKQGEDSPYLVTDPLYRGFENKKGVLEKFRKEQLSKENCTGFSFSSNKQVLKLYYKDGSYINWGLIPQVK